MNTRLTRGNGIAILPAAILIGGCVLPALYPARASNSVSATLHGTIQQLAFGHLFTGALGGFGVALLVWPFRRADK